VQQKVLREVLAGIGPSEFAEIEIKRPEPAWGPSPADSVALVVPHDENDLPREWLSWLIAHAFAQRSHDLGLPPVSYLAPRAGGVDAENLGPTIQGPARVTLADALDAAQKARQAAIRSGAEVDRLEILRPNGYAFRLHLRVEGDQARFLRDGLGTVLGSLGGPQPDDGPYAGDYALVVDGSGKRVWEGAEAYLGDGSIQVGGADRWELQGCGPYLLFGPPGRQPPACPVESAGEPSVQSSAPSDVTTRIVGATPKQESILREILAGLGETVIEEARVSPAGKDWTPVHPNSVVLHIDFTKADENARGYWEASLLAEAFDRRSRALNLQHVAAYETPGEGYGLQDPDEPGRPSRKPITAQELTSKAEAAAKESGASIVELRLVRPQHLALAITVEANNPADYLRHHLVTMLDAIPSPSDREYDGLYVLVVDRNGKFVWVSAGSVSDNMSGGGGGARPDLAGCDPRPSFGSTGYTPPPCPVD
jgi:hypothetical protein